MKQAANNHSPEKNTTKSSSQRFFGLQTKLRVNESNDAHEQEADRIAGEVMSKPATKPFFTPAPRGIQREEKDDKTGEVLSEGAGIVAEQLGENPAFEAWKEKQTEKLKYKLWDSQPADYKAGVVTFGLLNAGILGTTFALDPGFRAGAISTLEGANLLAPLSLVPYSEYFGVSGFKYKLPSAAYAPYTFNTEFELDAWFDLMRKKWNLPKVGLGFGIDSAYSQDAGFTPFTGGSLKVKIGGGIINVQGFLNHQLPAIPMLVTDPTKGEAPTWIMRSLPDQLDSNLPVGNGIFVTIDVLRLPELFGGGHSAQEEPSYRKSVEVHRKENNSGQPVNGSAPGMVDQVLSSGSGSPMDQRTQQFMENRLGQDFSDVRIHTNDEAAQSARAINAKAYTSGKDIVFDTAQYNPGTESGNQLLAHELVHVVQQTGTIQRKTGNGTDTNNDAEIAKKIHEQLEQGNYRGALVDLNDNTDGWTNRPQKKTWLRHHERLRKLFLNTIPPNFIAEFYSVAELIDKSPYEAFPIIDCWYQHEEEKQLLYTSNSNLFDHLLQSVSPYTGISMKNTVNDLTRRIESKQYDSSFGNKEFHIIHLLAPTVERKFRFYKQHADLWKLVKKKFDPFTGIRKKTMDFLTDDNEINRDEAVAIYEQLKVLPDEQRRAFLDTAAFAGALEADKDAEAWYKKNFKAQYKALPHNWDSAIMPWNWGNWDAPFAERLTIDHVALMSGALNYEDTATRKFGFDTGIDKKPVEKNGLLTSDAARLIAQLKDDANFGDPNRLVLLLAIAVRGNLEDTVTREVLQLKNKENKITHVNLPVIESYGFIAANDFTYQPDKAVVANHDKSLPWYLAKRTLFKGKESSLLGERRATVSVHNLQETDAMHGALGGMRFGTRVHDGDTYYNTTWLEQQINANAGSETLLPNINEFKDSNRVGKVFASIRPDIRQANIYASVLPIEGLNYFAAGSLYRSGEGVLQGLSINLRWTKDPGDPENSISLVLGLENLAITNIQLIAPKSTMAIGHIGIKGLRFTIDKNQNSDGYTFLKLFRDTKLTISTLMTVLPNVIKLIPFAIMTMTEEFKGARVHVYKEALGALLPSDFNNLRSSLSFTSLEVNNMYDTTAGFLDDFSIAQKDEKGNLVRQELEVRETISWQIDAAFDIKGRIKSIDNRIRSMKAELAGVDYDKKLEALEKDREEKLKAATKKGLHYERRDEEMNRLRQIYREIRELNRQLDTEFARAKAGNPLYDEAGYIILNKEKEALEKDLYYLENQYFEDRKLLEESSDRIERFETRKRIAEFESKYKSVDVAMSLSGITLKGGNYVRNLVNDSLQSLGFESPSFEGLENIEIGGVDSAFTVSGKGASSVNDKPGIAIRELKIPLVTAPSLFFKTEKIQLKGDAPRLEDTFVNVVIDFVANPLDRDPETTYKWKLAGLRIGKATFNGLQLFMGSDLPLLDFPVGVPVEAWDIHLKEYDPESGNIDLIIQDVKAQGSYQDKNEEANKSKQIGFGIDTTLDNDTEAGKKAAVELRYNKKDDSLETALNVASAWISSIDVQSPGMHVTSIPGINAVELKQVRADVKLLMERKAGDPKGARPMIVEINSLSIEEATAQGLKLKFMEAAGAGKKVQEVSLPEKDKVSLKKLHVQGLRITLDEAGATLSTIGDNASVTLGESDLGGIRYTERSAKGSVLRALAIHRGKFNSLTLEALARNGREYTFKEFLKFFGRTRLEGLDASASYNDGDISGTLGVKGKKNTPISIDYHEPSKDEPGYYSMRLPLERINVPALHIVKGDHEVIIPKPSNKAHTSYLSDVDAKLKAHLEFGADGKAIYDIQLESLHVVDMAVYGLEYHNKAKGIDVVFEKDKPLHIPNIKAGGFRFSSTKGFGVFGKAGGWASIAAGEEHIAASFESIKAVLENGEFLAEKRPGMTNSALDIDIESLGFSMDSADNMVITLGKISGAFPKFTITQSDPKTGTTTTTTISSVAKTISANQVVVKLNADTSKEIEATGITAGGLLLESKEMKGSATLSKTSVNLFDANSMGADSVHVKLNADKTKEITLKGIRGGQIDLDITSFDGSKASLKKIMLPKPEHIKIEAVHITIDDKGNKKIVVEKPTLRNFSLRMPDTDVKGDYISVLCDLEVAGKIEMGDGSFDTMMPGAPYDAFVLNVPDNVPVKVSNLHFEYKDTSKEKEKKDDSSGGLTPEQEKLLELEKARDDAYSNMLNTPSLLQGAGDNTIPNPEFDEAVDKYHEALKAYDEQKAGMISAAKAQAAASMTKKYLDAVQGNVKATIIVYNQVLKLDIETYKGEKYVAITDDLVSKMKPLIDSIIGSTVNAPFWKSEDMKKIGKSLQRWYTNAVPYTRGLINAIADGNALGAVLVFLQQTEISKGALADNPKMFGLNFNFDTSWLLDMTSYDEFGVPLCEMKYQHPDKKQFFNLYGMIEHYGYVSPATVSLEGQRDAANVKRISELTSKELDDKGIKEAIFLLIGYIKENLTLEAANIVKAVRQNIEGVGVDADISLMPQQVITELLKEKNKGSFEFDKGKSSIDNLHMTGVYLRDNNPQASGIIGSGAEGKDNIEIPGGRYTTEDKGTRVSYDKLVLTPVMMNYHDDVLKVMNENMFLHGLKIGVKKK